MEKNKGLAKLHFLLRAKGRHGTHSPFVYAFVEQVLRNKHPHPNCPPQWSQKEWDLWQSTIDFLQPANIFIDQEHFPELFPLLSEEAQTQRIKPLKQLSVLTPNKDNLILAHAHHLKPIATLSTQPMTAEGRLSIYIARPHTPQVDSDMEPIIQQPLFKMVMDFWHALLIVQSADFKEKQRFKLR